MPLPHILRSPLERVFAGSFIFFIHLALTLYINSSFLDELFREGIVGLLFTLGSLLTIIGLAMLPNLLRRVGSKTVLMLGLVTSMISLLGLALVHNPIFIAVLFIIYFSTNTLITFGIDVFLENLSDKQTLGKTRGVFLTLKHVALMSIPLLTGILIDTLGFRFVYGVAAGTAALACIFFFRVQRFKEPSYYHQNVFSTIRHFKHYPPLRMVFLAAFLLRFFLASMVIFAPIYLVHHIGLSWEQVGGLISIMLIAFVILDYPLGRIADRPQTIPRFTALGFSILGIGSLAIGLLQTQTFIIWAGILFLTRIGASMVIVMTEAYFFKHNEREEITSMSLFRDTTPLSYIVASLFGATLISIVPMHYLFIALGIVMLVGIRYAVALRKL